MAIFEYIYNFDKSESSGNNDWLYDNPNKTNELYDSTTNDYTTRAWNWNNGSTYSKIVGPEAPYSGAGYIYTESSAPTKKNDKFVLTTNYAIDASDKNIHFGLMYSAHTRGTDCQFIIKVFNGNKWVKEFDQNIGSDSRDWINVELDLTHYDNPDMLIKIIVDVSNDGSTWYKDIGIDHIYIKGVDNGDDPVVKFLKIYEIYKLTYNSISFNAKHLTHIEIMTIISDLLSSDVAFDIYPNGIVIIESDNIVHNINKDVS